MVCWVGGRGGGGGRVLGFRGLGLWLLRLGCV